MPSGIGRTKQQRGDICPSCERFIGPALTCPYCEMDSAGSATLRSLRLGAMVLAVVGLGFLYLMATRTEIPIIRVDSLTPMMNFAQIRIVGEVERDAYIARENGEVDYLSFSVNDGSGRLRVAAYDDVARAIVEKGIAPKKGMRVDVAGSVSIPAGRKQKLRMQTVEQLVVRD